MSLTLNHPDSKYLEKTKVSSSLHESLSTVVHSNGKEDLSTQTLIESKSKNDNSLKSNGSTPHSMPSTPPPLEPIPASLFPGESAKIYPGMPGPHSQEGRRTPIQVEGQEGRPPGTVTCTHTG